jgi:hypothetical protein
MAIEDLTERKASEPEPARWKEDVRAEWTDPATVAGRNRTKGAT